MRAARLDKLEAYLVIALMVRDALGILLVEVEAVLYQELHRLWFYNILFHAQQGKIENLGQVGVFTLKERVGSIKILEEKPHMQGTPRSQPSSLSPGHRPGMPMR